MAPTPDRWKDILLDPCNRAAARRNWQAVRDMLEDVADQLDDPVETGQGDSSLLPFVVDGPPSGSPLTVPVKIVDRNATPWDFTIDKTGYDPTGRIFTPNMEVGHYGYCRLLPEIDEDAVEIIWLEGRVRFITGVADSAESGGEIVVDIDDTGPNAATISQFGNIPNSQENIGTLVTMKDRLGFVAGEPAGTKIIGIYDEQTQEYIAISARSPSAVLMPFVVTEAGLNGACVVKVVNLNTMSSEPWEFTEERRAFDPFYHLYDAATAPADPNRAGTARGVFDKNMKVGHFGYCREVPDHPSNGPGVADAVEIVTLEGRARFITGTLDEQMGLFANMTVTYNFGAYPNDVPVTGSVLIHDRMSMMTNQPAGTAAMGIYDEDLDQYVAIGPAIQENQPSDGVNMIEICDAVTNNCCLMLGFVTKTIGAADETCGLIQCGEPVWVGCENQKLLPDTDYSDPITAPVAILDWNGNRVGTDPPNQYCDWARDTGLMQTCNGATLPVYTLRCPCLGCVCPPHDVGDDNITIKAVYDPAGPPYAPCYFPNVDLRCVRTNPATGASPGTDEELWYGEFEVDGYYPRIAYEFSISATVSITDPITGEEDTTDVLYLVWVPKVADPCDVSNFEVWAEINGKWFEYSGTSVVATSNPGIAYPVLDRRDNPGPGTEGYVIVQAARFRYGMIASCISPPTGSSHPTVNHFYLLNRNATTTTEPCDDLVVMPASAVIKDAGTTLLTNDSSCCQVSRQARTDYDWGGYSGGAGGDPCTSPTIPSIITSYPAGFGTGFAYKDHVFGGCWDGIKEQFDGWGVGFSEDQVEFGNPVAAPGAQPAWRVSYPGQLDKVECT